MKCASWNGGLLTQVSDLQAKIKDVNATLAEYENLPLFRRLSLQALGKTSNRCINTSSCMRVSAPN